MRTVRAVSSHQVMAARVSSLRAYGASSLASACLMLSSYASTLRSVIVVCAWLRAFPLVVSACFASSSVPVPVPSHCFSPSAPSHSTRLAGRCRWCRGCSRLCLLAHRLVAPFHGYHRIACYSVLIQSDFLTRYARLIASSSHRFPAPLMRHGGGAWFSWSRLLAWRLVRSCYSICPAVCLRGFCECGVCGLPCLLGCRIMYLSMGDVVARRCVSGL